MNAEAKVTIVNKSASLQTVTYTNWTYASPSTSRSVVIPAGSSFVTYNWWELDPDDGVTHVAVTENIFNLPIDEGTTLTKILIQDFAYDKDRVSITLTAGSYSA
jgi:hypothetical protein